MPRQSKPAVGDMLQMFLRIKRTNHPHLYSFLSAIPVPSKSSKARTTMVLALAERGLVLEAILRGQLSPSQPGQPPELVSRLLAEFADTQPGEPPGAAHAAPGSPAGDVPASLHAAARAASLQAPVVDYPVAAAAAPAAQPAGDPAGSGAPGVAPANPSAAAARPAPAPVGGQVNQVPTSPSTSWGGLEVDDSPLATRAFSPAAGATEPVAGAIGSASRTPDDARPRPSLAGSSVLNKLIRDQAGQSMRPPTTDPK